MKLSIVTPLYKSAPYIEELHQRSVMAIHAVGVQDYEIILVNDGSPDDSLAIARSVAERDPNVIVLDLSRNFGQQRALLAGLARSTGDLVFIMDSDLEEEPEWIGLFHKALTSSDADVIYGVQIAKKRGLIYRSGRRLFYVLLNALSDMRFPENVTTARLMTRRYVNAVMQFREREIPIPGIWHATGFTQNAVKVMKHDTSPTAYTLTKLVGMFVNGVTSFSTKPLLAIGIAGISLSILAALYTAWIVFRKLAWGVSVDGWASVMAATLLIGGVSLFFNGVMAIYIAKIFIEVKQRPRAIVRDIYQQPQDAAGTEERNRGVIADLVRE